MAWSMVSKAFSNKEILHHWGVCLATSSKAVSVENMDLKPVCDSVNRYEINKKHWTCIWLIASSIFSYYGTAQFSTVFFPFSFGVVCIDKFWYRYFWCFSVRPLTMMTVIVVILIGINNSETPVRGFKYVSFMVLISFSESPHVACRINLVPMENTLGTRLLQNRSNFCVF